MTNTPEEIEKGMVRTNIKLQGAIEEIPELINTKAQAEKDYELSLSKKILQLKIDKVPTTLIPKLAQGDEIVSSLKFKVNVATEMLKIQYAKLKAFEIAINSYQSMHALRRIEYQKSNYTG